MLLKSIVNFNFLFTLLNWLLELFKLHMWLAFEAHSKFLLVNADMDGESSNLHSCPKPLHSKFIDPKTYSKFSLNVIDSFLGLYQNSV